MNFGGIAAIALQTNADIIVAAGQAGLAPSDQTQFTSSFALARYLSSGHLDNTFGTEGRVTTSFGKTNVAFISGMAIQIDGKIVVAGTTGDSFGNFAVARYLAQLRTGTGLEHRIRHRSRWQLPPAVCRDERRRYAWAFVIAAWHDTAERIPTVCSDKRPSCTLDTTMKIPLVFASLLLLSLPCKSQLTEPLAPQTLEFSSGTLRLKAYLWEPAAGSFSCRYV
jgi:hypothetical protein